jgi:hypothetical protein
MEARWISVIVGERAPSSLLRASFFVFRVKVCKSNVQVVVPTPRAIRSPRLQPHLGGNVEGLVRVVWSSRIFFWLWRSSDHQGASSAVFPSSYPRRM